MSAAPQEPPQTAAPSTGRRIVLLRHGRTEWNARRRWQGQLDPPLDEAGRRQAQDAAEALAHPRPDVLLSSDLQRARQTADIVAGTTGSPVRLDAGLRETHIGDWEGRTSEEISAQWARELDLWFTGDVAVRPPGGENRMEVAARMVAAIRTGLGEVGKAGTLMVVTHGGAARVAVAALLGLEHRSWGAIGGLGNCSWSVLAERAGQSGQPVRWRLLEHNIGVAPPPNLAATPAAPDETGGP